MDKTNENVMSAPAPEGKRRRRKKSMAPLISAAKRVSKLICELSADRELFVTDSGQKSEKRLDTKALKEFSGVIKELCAVMAELHLGEGLNDGGEGIRIEFSDEAEEMSG